MHRAGVLSVLALGTWSLVGCQILVRQDGTPGVNATRHATADAAAERDADARTQDDSHAEPWRVAWVRHGGHDLFVDDARGVVLTGGNVYDVERGLHRGKVVGGTRLTLPDGRAVHRDGEGRLTLGDDASDDADHILAQTLLPGHGAFATIEVAWEEDHAVATLIVRRTEDLHRTLVIELPGDWSTFERAQVVATEDGRLMINLPPERSRVPRLVAADVDGSLTPIDFPVEGEAVGISGDARTLAVSADGGVELRDLASGLLLHRIDDVQVQGTAVDHGGTGFAFVTPDHSGDPQLQIWRSDAHRHAWTRTYAAPTDASFPALAFGPGGTNHGSPTLWVAADDLVAIRRGPAEQRSPIAYGVALPESFEAVELDREPSAARLSRLLYQERDGATTVWVRAHERRAFAPAGEDLGAWSETVLASLHGVPEQALADPTWAHLAHGREGGDRVTEVVVPACEIGGSNADLYVHLEERDDQLIEVAIMTAPGTEPDRVAALLDTFVDEPLGGSPVARDLPRLPALDCGI